MARKRHQKSPSQTSKSKSSKTKNTQSSQQDLINDVKESLDTAIKDATLEEIEAVTNIEIPEDISADVIKVLYQKMEEARKLFNFQSDRYKNENNSLDKEKEKFANEQKRLDDEKQTIEYEKQELKEESEEIKQKLKLLDEKENLIIIKESDLALREANAEAGFLKQYQEVIERANEQLAEFHNSLGSLTSDLAKTRNEELQKLNDELNAVKKIHDETVFKDLKKLEEEQNKLVCEREEIDTASAKLVREQRKLRLDQESLEEDREQLQEEIDLLVERKTQRVKDELEFFKEKYKDSESDRQRLMGLLKKWDDISKKINADVENIPKHFEGLEQKIKELKNRLENVPSQQELERFKKLEDEISQLDNDKFVLGQQFAETKRKLAAARTQVVEHEDLRTEKLSLEASRKILEQQNQQLRNDINTRLEMESEGDSVFPRCYAMDKEFSKSFVTENVGDLKDLAIDIQNRISQNGLFYKDRDIRSFIAGMAMSRMFILQGISGTGKTSLPIQFAKAVGGDCEVIEVQAGWRDRDDLLGHFNAFEHQFYEKKFLQGLYRAGTPEFKDRIFIILLDEMNLSYPEQYFADFLSVLEREKNDHWIDLLPRNYPERPSPMLLNDGRRIKIPANVWFVGTANRDETTRDIADKTYDRSHVMELPVNHPEPQNNNEIISSPPMISFKNLESIFRDTLESQSYQAEIDKAWKFLKDLRQFLSSRMGVGWGNRLHAQLSSYLPILRSSGGLWSDAVDDLLALKILRKIRDRYEIQRPDLEELLEKIDEQWSNVDKKMRNEQNSSDGLERTMKLIDDELSKKPK